MSTGPPEASSRGTTTSPGIVLDLADGAAVGELIDKVRPDVVFHLASHVAGAREVELVAPTFDANLASTVHLLTAVTRHGCRRFIQVGSLEEPEPGEAVAVPSSPYAAAKMAASAYARMFHGLYGTPVVLARLFMVYGPAQKDLRKLIPYLVLSLLRGREPKLSSGSREVDWIYVDDVVDGLILAAECDGNEGPARRPGLGQADDPAPGGRDSLPPPRPRHGPPLRFSARSRHGASAFRPLGGELPAPGLAPADLARGRPRRHRRLVSP